MEKFGKIVVKLRTPILILALLLMIPAFLGMLKSTKLSYHMALSTWGISSIC